MAEQFYVAPPDEGQAEERRPTQEGLELEKALKMDQIKEWLDEQGRDPQLLIDAMEDGSLAEFLVQRKQRAEAVTQEAREAEARNKLERDTYAALYEYVYYEKGKASHLFFEGIQEADRQHIKEGKEGLPPRQMDLLRSSGAKQLEQTKAQLMNNVKAGIYAGEIKRATDVIHENENAILLTADNKVIYGVVEPGKTLKLIIPA